MNMLPREKYLSAIKADEGRLVAFLSKSEYIKNAIHQCQSSLSDLLSYKILIPLISFHVS